LYKAHYCDINAIKRDDTFIKFQSKTGRLSTVNLSSFAPLEKKVFFINIYNLLMLHSHVILGPPTSNLKRLAFFHSLYYNIDYNSYTLDDIKHGILRGNAPPVAEILKGSDLSDRETTRVLLPPHNYELHLQLGSSHYPQQYFARNDPRRAHILEELDPRIHFSLCTFSIASPLLYVYKTDTLEHQLEEACNQYCGTFVRVRSKENKVLLPKVFLWFQDDFLKDRALLEWIKSKLGDEKKLERFDTILKANNDVKMTYEAYNWQPKYKFIRPNQTQHKKLS